MAKAQAAIEERKRQIAGLQQPTLPTPAVQSKFPKMTIYLDKFL